MSYRTVSGHELDLLEIRPEDIRIDDVAHHLSMTCRFNGATPAWYCNAQHCCLVSKLSIALTVDEPLPFQVLVALAAQVHDAGEPYTGDMTRPMKEAMRKLSGAPQSVFDVIEHSVLRVVEDAFALGRGRLTDPEDPVAKIVKHADNLALEIEEAVLRDGDPGGLDLTHWHDRAWTQEEAKSRFLERFELLYFLHRAQ